MTDNPSTNQSQSVAQVVPTTTHTQSPVITPPVVAPAVVESDTTPPSNTTPRIATPHVTTPPPPLVEGVPQRDRVIDQRVVALRAMFPDYDDLVLFVRSTPCPPIDRLLTRIVITGYPCLILWAETRTAPLMLCSV